ncbi:CAF17-like 4Fe-4S cluster assembly/insertion protein YgfZ [Chloroflexus sp.]|uniref:CAF17-like 4Fe-4S cluster assembly/insertion protein YgfZ n=1 Tax=Chloroflexus sp. TaxID=1904827 RepID=UPI002610C311|nr:glycine cleavage T C-terminal barrel domain-containing protein [uncultured Chloroflexus sp.]
MSAITAYQAIYTGAVVADETDRGRLWMRGRDRAALLHRLSTNHIERLQPGQGTLTVLTTPIGRMIDLLRVYALPDALLLETGPEHGAPILRHLRKNIFFNDQVTVADAGAELGQIGVYGPQAGQVAQKLGLPSDLSRYSIVVGRWGEIEVLVARCDPLGGDGYTLYPPASQTAALLTALTAAGAVLLDRATAEIARVEHGYPRFGREITLDYIPLEADLWRAVSFQKGCYVGQEIIARMESRGRIAKQLRGLQLQAPPESLPAKVLADTKEIGDLTSVVNSPRYGWIGLAYLRSVYAEAGTTVLVANQPATVCRLPFVPNHSRDNTQ